MPLLLDAVLLFVVLVAWGAQAMVPWRLAAAAQTSAAQPHHAPDQDAAAAAAPAPARARAEGAGVEAVTRRLWRLAGFPLAIAGLVAALVLADRNPDAAVAAHLVPLLASPPGRLLAVLVPALLASSLIAGLAGGRLDGAGQRIAAALALAACAAESRAGELLRAGEGPSSPAAGLVLLVACRLALTLAAGELLAPGRPRWAAPGGLALLAYLALLPGELRGVLWSQGLPLTCGAAALLLVAARWLPGALRRLALAAGLLLAAIVLAQAGHVSQALAPTLEIQHESMLR
jgi:hypothetical protein